MLEELDFAAVRDSQTENDQLRSAWLLQRYVGRAGFEGLCQLRSLGWRDQRSLVFQLAVEREAKSLEDWRKEELLGYQLPGTSVLLAARAMAHVLLTVENLATEGIVPTTITWRSFCLRPGLRSGYLRRISFC